MTNTTLASGWLASFSFAEPRTCTATRLEGVGVGGNSGSKESLLSITYAAQLAHMQEIMSLGYGEVLALEEPTLWEAR